MLSDVMVSYTGSYSVNKLVVYALSVMLKAVQYM